MCSQKYKQTKRTRFPKPKSPALPTGLPGDPNIDPSFSDASNKSNSSNDRNSSKLNIKKRDKKKKRRKYRKMTCQNHHQATILIRPTTVIIYANYRRSKSIRKRIR